MSQPWSLDRVASALAEEVTHACGVRLGGEATTAPVDAPATVGWTLTIAVTGPVSGRVTVWFDRASAAALAQAALRGDDAPTDVAIGDLLIALSREAASAVRGREDGAELEFAEPVAGQGTIGAGARAVSIAVPNAEGCLLAVGVERPPASRADVSRLGAVLDVDLPLIVRFGRAVMPLRDVAHLGPGSVVDLGRSPDEPVDLLVGERLIARGEVVVVGGNYGVRITHLAAGGSAATDKETRTL